MQVKQSQPLNMSDVRETMTHLYTFGRFDDVQVEAEAAPGGGVAITILLQPIHLVTKVEFRGQLGLPEGALRDRMAERFSATPPVARAPDVAAALQELYTDSGYISAVVTPAPTIIEHDPDRATLVFDVTAGPRTRIARSEITGAPLEPSAKVEERLRIAPSAPYQPADLRQRLTSYVTWMRKQSHYEADARELPPKFNADRTEADLVVEVRPGPVVTIQFTGDPLPPDKRSELVPIEREGSVDQDILEDAARRITDYLQQQGYWKANVDVPDRKEENGRLTIVFNVQRGPLFRLAPGGLQILGTQAITLDELRTGAHLADVKLGEGDPFIASKMSAIEGAIKQFYREHGFATALIESQPNQVGPSLVQPVIVVKEGPRVLVGAVTVRGNEQVPTKDLLERVNVKTGAPYYGPNLAADRDRLETLYLDRGFQSAEITVPQPQPVAEGVAARADVTFQIHEGVQTSVEHIFVTGNVKTSENVIRRELRIKEGAPLGQQELTESRRSLAALGLFRRIQISSVSRRSRTERRRRVGRGGAADDGGLRRRARVGASCASEVTGDRSTALRIRAARFFGSAAAASAAEPPMNLYTQFGLR